MARRIGRRSFLAGGAAAAAGFAIGDAAAESLMQGIAGATAPPGRTNGPGRNGVSNAKPKTGGSVTFGTDAEEQGFDPTSSEWDEVGYTVGRCIFDPLMAVTTTGQVVPYLAQSLTHNPNYTSWTINLRPNVSFHDGTPCDGAALLFNLQKQTSSILTSTVFSQFISNISQTGPLSVRVDMKSPWVTFPYYASSSAQVGYIAAPSMLRNSNGASHPVGTGPFVFQSWEPNSHFTATRNKQYWRKGLPYLDQITFKPIIDYQARQEALQAGNVDMMMTFSAPTIVQYRGNRQFSYVDDSGAVVGEPAVNFIQLNCMSPPFDDHGARLAMAKCFSQSEFDTVIGEGVSGPVNGPFAPGTPFYSKTSYPGYDPSGARRLVKSYEQRTGKSFSFTLNYIPDPLVARSAAWLQQRYKSAGMKVGLAVFDQNTLIANTVEGKFQAVTWRQFGVVDPDLNYVFWSTSTVKKNGISLNIARNYDPRIQQALVTGRSSPNPSARAKAYQSIGEYFAQDLPYTWLGRAVWAVIANPKVQNFANPAAPNGNKLIGMGGGVIWPTQVWVS